MTENKDLLVVGNLAKDAIGNNEKFGGSAASIAVNAKRLGLSTGILSVLGVDSFSQKYHLFLTESGVSTDLITTPLTELPICEVVSNDNTTNCSVWHDKGCHPAMEEIEIKTETVAQYQVIHLVSCPPGLARRLSPLGLTLSYEPGPMLVNDSAYFDSEVAKKSKFIFLNEEENAVVMESRGYDSPDKLLTSNGQTLIVTRGKHGSELFTRAADKISHQLIKARLINDLEIIDHIGAGDGYKAGFLSAYLSGHQLLTCAQIGTEVGALAVQQAGGIIEEQKLAYLRQTLRHEQ